MILMKNRFLLPVLDGLVDFVADGFNGAKR